MSVADIAKAYLFGPLEISRYRWNSYADGHTNTDGGLSMRPRDMAKIGQLMLDNGYWHGVKIISPEWVAESTQAHTRVMLGVRYGYQWWRESQPILLESVEPYFAAGYGGQLITVYPDHDLIIIVTGETADHNENTSRYIYLRNNYLLPAAISGTPSKAILWSWYLLTFAGLAFLFFDIAKRRIGGFGRSAAWLLSIALFGPLGLLVYLLSYRHSKARKTSFWKTLGISILITTGNILLAVYQYLFLTEGNVTLLVIPVSFLVSWLFFIAPLTKATSNMRYGKALRQTLLTGIISSCLVWAGILPVLILMDFRWPHIEPNHVLFWIMMTACGIAGTLLLYPFSFWKSRRNLDFWPAKQQNERFT